MLRILSIQRAIASSLNQEGFEVLLDRTGVHPVPQNVADFMFVLPQYLSLNGNALSIDD